MADISDACGSVQHRTGTGPRGRRGGTFRKGCPVGGCRGAEPPAPGPRSGKILRFVTLGGRFVVKNDTTRVEPLRRFLSIFCKSLCVNSQFWCISPSPPPLRLSKDLPTYPDEATPASSGTVTEQKMRKSRLFMGSNPFLSTRRAFCARAAPRAAPPAA